MDPAFVHPAVIGAAALNAKGIRQLLNGGRGESDRGAGWRVWE